MGNKQTRYSVTRKGLRDDIIDPMLQEIVWYISLYPGITRGGLYGRLYSQFAEDSDAGVGNTHHVNILHNIDALIARAISYGYIRGQKNKYNQKLV